MSENREIYACAIYDIRLAYIRRLWEPETKDFSGRPLDRPRYSVVGFIPKTKEKWTDEPIFESVRAASAQIYRNEFRGTPADQLIWPVKDGDVPNTKGVVAEWLKDCWRVTADTTSGDYLTVQFDQGDGKLIHLTEAKLGGRVVVKDGDYGTLFVGLTKSAGREPGIKTYLNGVVFTRNGEPLKLGGARQNTEAMIREARDKGLIKGSYGPPARELYGTGGTANGYSAGGSMANGYSAGGGGGGGMDEDIPW